MKSRLPWLALLALALPPGSPAEAAPVRPFSYQGTVEVSPLGDAVADIRLGLGALYPLAKEQVPDPIAFLHRLRWQRADYEIAPGSTVRYNDADSTVHVSLTMLGAARRARDGRWSLDLGPDSRFEGTTPGPGDRPRVAVIDVHDYPDGDRYDGRWTLVLPSGARNVRWEAASHLLAWTLEVSEGRGEGALEVTLAAPDRLMTCPYKVYAVGPAMAEHWVARTVLRNTGTGALKDLEVRYRLGGYSEWSPWSRYGLLLPGQTTVDVHHPVLDASIAKLRSSTPANVFAEWAWTGSDGKRHTGDDARKTTLLGVNDVMFERVRIRDRLGGWVEATANAPLIAAWVTRNDPVLKEFAALANKNAGGALADQNDETALAVMQQCYELLLRNDVTYQGATGLIDTSVSFDERLVQAVRFPREVIRDRSGTCIELAVLYAAMLQVLGLEPFLVSIPGHCFPAVRLPKSKELRGVEATMLRGAHNGDFDPFSHALEEGTKELVTAVLSRELHLIDLQAVWGRGVSNPELDDLPPDTLSKWQITAEGKGLPQRRVVAAEPGGTPGQPGGPEMPVGHYAVSGALSVGPLGDLGLSFTLSGTFMLAPTGQCLLNASGSGVLPIQARLLGGSVEEPRSASWEAQYTGMWNAKRQLVLLRPRKVTVVGDPGGGTPQQTDLEGGLLLVALRGEVLVVLHGSEEGGWVDLGLTLKKQPPEPKGS